jgi:hypothetical protein
VLLRSGDEAFRYRIAARRPLDLGGDTERAALELGLRGVLFTELLGWEAALLVNAPRGDVLKDQAGVGA